MTQGVYVALGLTLVTFLLTFTVAPRFKEQFKEDESWLEIYDGLVQLGGVESISPANAASRAKRRNCVLMDVRLARRFQQGAMSNSQNYPFYQPISGWGVAANIRRAGFAFFGIYGTERNLGWLEEVEAKVPKGTEIIVACEMGGSLQTKPGAAQGFQSQSLKAAYYLKRAGYRVLHLQGGIDEYRRTVGPLVGVEELEEAEQEVMVSVGRGLSR